MATTVAILGTGKMGAAMARRLHQQGFELRLWNRSRQRAEQLGVGQVFDTPAEAASGAEVVISMLITTSAPLAASAGVSKTWPTPSCSARWRDRFQSRSSKPC